MKRLEGTKWTKLERIVVIALMMGCILLSSVIVVFAAKDTKFQDNQKVLAFDRSYKPKILNKPSNAKYTWKSSNPKVATVSSKGTVKAIKEGKTKISCTIKSGRKTSTIKMTVQVKQPSLKKKSGTIVYGEKATIIIGNKPKDATYTWKTTNKEVATVNSEGVVTAQNAGETTINVTVKWKAGKKTLSYRVNVKKPELSTKTLSLQVGESSALAIKNKPKKATYRWTSSNSSVASVSASGIVTAKNRGKTVIQCDIQAGKKKITLFCNLTIEELLTVTPQPPKLPSVTPGIPEIPEIPGIPGIPGIPEVPSITPRPTGGPTQARNRYTYDALGRVIKVEYSDGTTIRYSYDKNGNITKVEKE